MYYEFAVVGIFVNLSAIHWFGTVDFTFVMCFHPHRVLLVCAQLHVPLKHSTNMCAFIGVRPLIS